ncbi:MAG TPA: COX15/CtaA family protein [Ilumatobacteraceae bacterium]|nr:COX15/CtaA family protein [Ilumatobacteraceae bacterium]
MESDRPRVTMSLRRYRQIAILTVAGVCFLTVAGATVRLTGSGLGCADWPACNQERFIDVSTGHAAIEQLNRLLSGLIGVPTLLMAIGAFRVWPRRRGLRVPSVMVFLTVFGNGVVGGFAVMGDLHPALVQSHFLLAMASIAFGLVAIRRARPEPVVHRRTIGVGPAAVRLFALFAVGMAASLVTGTVVTGSGPHAGDESARRFGFDISAVAEVHSVTVWVTVAVFLWLVVVLRRDPSLYARLSTAIATWMFLAVLQGGIGYVQYFNNIPAVLVGAHVAGATALWVVSVQFVHSAIEPLSSDPSVDGPGIHTPETDDRRGIAVSPVASA